MRQVLFTGLLSFAYLLAAAQAQEAGELMYKFKKASGYEQQSDLLYELSKYYQNAHPDSSYLFAQRLEAMATAHKDLHRQYRAQLLIAQYFTTTGKAKEALAICEKVLAQLPKDEQHADLMVDFWRLKGGCLMLLNEQQEALNTFYELLKISEKSGAVYGRVAAITNIGWVYMELYQFDRAITELNTAKSLAETNTGEMLPVYIPKIYNNLASCYGAKGQMDSAYLYTNKGIAAALKINDYATAANGLNILGTAFMEEKKYREALEKLLQAKSLRQKVGNPFFIVSDMATLASLYNAMGNTTAGIQTSKEALDIAKARNIDAKLPMLYLSLANGYEAAGNYRDAAGTYKRLSILKDTLFEKANSEAIATMRVQYETEKKEHENKLLKNENALKAALISNKNRTIYILVALALFVAALLFGWVMRVRLRKKEGELKAVADLQKEKERIARDLHDNVGGQLSYIIYSLDGVHEESREKRAEITANINQSVRSVIGSLRETIWAISDASIRLQDFSDKLKLYVRNLFNRNQVKIVFNENIRSQKELNALLGLNLYRICQEILTNAFKYSGADEIRIGIRSDAEALMISIEDNGTGFDVSQPNTESYGLQNIRKRAGEFGIELTLETAVGAGTRYNLVV
ncbi:histidine kinase [Niabella pedocola]|uniref:histidine kinase n=1 Tax=Niabella pedocola TaxID=1752077 RepID=A0ABS8PS47_9BACT|nr:histidine kinase [Niabella pedocola]MCD2423897.1 histidine kinase [Niabella pedocola]